MTDSVEMKNPVCPKTGVPMYRDTRPMTVTFKGNTSTFDMPGWYCDESDESVHNGTDMNISDEVLAELKTRVRT